MYGDTHITVTSVHLGDHLRSGIIFSILLQYLQGKPSTFSHSETLQKNGQIVLGHGEARFKNFEIF